MRVVLTTASLDDEDDELQVEYVLPSPPTRHHTIATNLSYGTGAVMLAKVIQGISRLPLAATSPSATLLWHVLAGVFVSYREEEVMLSSTLGIKVRTPWPPSLSDPTLCVCVCIYVSSRICYPATEATAAGFSYTALSRPRLALPILAGPPGLLLSSPPEERS